MQHRCIKPACGKQYNSNDPDPDYCPSCQQEKKAIAAQIDARMSTKIRKPVTSDLQHFEQSAKMYTDPNTGRQIFFGRA